MKLCVVIPALNEEATIAEVIKRIPRQIELIDLVQVVVVDDGSTDKTVELSKQAGATVVSHPENLGVGAAFRTGVNQAIILDADIMVNIDADGQFSPEDIPKLVRPILERHADFVTASRFKEKAFYPDMTKVKFYGNQMMARLISLLTGKRFYDVSCGFRAYSREAFLMLSLLGDFTYTQETFLDLSFKGIRIQEVPLKIRGIREFGESRVASNIRKYAVRTSKIILRSFRDYQPMVFFGTFALILLAISALMGGGLLLYFLHTGLFSPYKSVGFVAAALLFLSVLIFVTGLQADMLSRIRIHQERMLYLLKKHLIKHD